MMMKKFVPVLLIFAFAVAALAQKQSLAPDLQAMVETERAFAHTATEKSIRDSFLAFIADDGILFRPTAVNGKQFLEKQQPRPGLLTWQPTYADISAAGDMGFTSGPWEFRPKGPEDQPVAFGTFATVWRKQADGTWKFAIDFGIEHDKPAALATAWTLPANFKRNRTSTKADAALLQSALVTLDQEFSKASASQGAAKAFLDYAADEIRFLKNGSSPVIGRKETANFLAASTSALSLQPIRAEVATSGDLGFTYGTYDFKGSAANAEAEKGNYVRFWKKIDGKWKVVMSVMNELPKPS